ncbi:MAG: Hsp20 family protein [Paracoccus sp. (in: a-proteobacteria)]|nr:Hsp20 family protein [Paracoccus sp. (in: a-proteobacteria)]
MTKLTLAAHPHLLGFDQIERLVERAAKGAEGYPPYNIEHQEPDGFTITLAVAGFSEGDLTVSLENSQLTIAGRQPDPGPDRVYLHRGIASRAFQRSFVLADGVEVDGAKLENGLLMIALRRRPQESIVKTIPISRK